MTSLDLDTTLRDSLGDLMSPKEVAALDAALTTRLARRRRVPQGRAAALLVAALLVAAPTVIAVSAAMRTSETPNGLESASAFQAEIDAAKSVVPIPSGYTWPATLRASDPGASYSKGGGRAQVEFVAVCAWSTAWLRAEERGRARDASDAAGLLGSVTDWTLYAGEFSSDSLRTVLDSVIAGAARGDRGPVKSFVGANCRT